MMKEDQNKRKIVMLIGNGFDLNLGLKTSYKDFLASEQFEEYKKEGSQLAEYLSGKYELNNWIDIENELKIYSKDVYTSQDRKEFKRDYHDLCKYLCEYINCIHYDAIDKDSNAYQLFIKQIRSDNAQIYIYDFNYTETVSKIIEDNKVDQKAETQIIKVHGTAADNKIVFGVEDDAYINPDDSFLYKSGSHHYNSEININEKLKTANGIVVIGHSLGETDHFYFKRFFQDSIYPKSKKFTFTYYTEDGWDALIKQLQDLTLSHLADFRSNNDNNFIEI